MRLIYINIGLFVIIRVVSVVLSLSSLSSDYFLHLIELPSDVELLMYRPWTIITYMFAQYDILHILFNMLWLYWFGAIFLQFFHSKQLLALYIYGGIGGGLLYILAYYTLPYLTIGGNGYLLGASASVIAIVVVTALRAPNYKVGLLFFGAVSLKWIAAVTIFIDVISIDSSNAGGHIAHLGGAFVGLMYVLLSQKGIDITTGFTRLMDWAVLLFKPSQKNVFKKKKTNYKYSASSNNNNKNAQSSSSSSGMDNNDMAQMDIILDKIKKSGYSSLSSDEKKRLFDVSKK